MRSRTPGRSGTAKPRAASSGRISPMTRETVERAVPYSSASAACGSPVRRWTRVTSTRSVKTRSYFGPAPAARRRAAPRRSRSADSHCASHGSANSSIKSPRCARETPQKAGGDKAARAHFLVTHEEPVRPLSRHGRRRQPRGPSRGRGTVAGQAFAGVLAIAPGGRIMKTSIGSWASTTNPWRS